MARINWTRKITTTAVTALAAATLGVGNMSQASAEEYPCSYPGLMCVYTDSNFQGGVYQSGNTAHFFVDGMNDVISSIINHSGTTMCYFEDPNYQGNYIELENDRAAPYLLDYNDKISSYGPCDQTLG